MNIIVTTEEELRNIITDCIRTATIQPPPMPPALREEEPPITQPEALKFTKKSRQTFSKWRKKGIIKAHVLGGRIYYFKSELIAAMK